MYSPEPEGHRFVVWVIQDLISVVYPPKVCVVPVPNTKASFLLKTRQGGVFNGRKSSGKSFVLKHLVDTLLAGPAT